MYPGNSEPINVCREVYQINQVLLKSVSTQSVLRWYMGSVRTQIGSFDVTFNQDTCTYACISICTCTRVSTYLCTKVQGHSHVLGANVGEQSALSDAVVGENKGRTKRASVPRE